jgi:5,10-methylenetetrahydrofolate reductase
MELSPRIRDLVAARQEKKDEIVVSIEFFPPKTEAGMTSLYNLAEKLKVYRYTPSQTPLNPSKIPCKRLYNTL